MFQLLDPKNKNKKLQAPSAKPQACDNLSH